MCLHVCGWLTLYGISHAEQLGQWAWHPAAYTNTVRECYRLMFNVLRDVDFPESNIDRAS